MRKHLPAPATRGDLPHQPQAPTPPRTPRTTHRPHLCSHVGMWPATKANTIQSTSLFRPLVGTPPGGGGKRVPLSSPHRASCFYLVRGTHPNPSIKPTPPSGPRQENPDLAWVQRMPLTAEYCPVPHPCVILDVGLWQKPAKPKMGAPGPWRETAIHPAPEGLGAGRGPMWGCTASCSSPRPGLQRQRPQAAGGSSPSRTAVVALQSQQLHGLTNSQQWFCGIF